MGRHKRPRVKWEEQAAQTTCSHHTEGATSMPQQFSCAQCGAAFRAYPSQRKRFCAKACAYRWSHERLSLVERFWSKVRPTPSCWWWTGGTSAKGYGLIAIGKHRMRQATQVSWEIANGRRFPPGMQANHTCDHPSCVRPDHIYPGTQKQNLADMYARNRRRHHRDARGVFVRAGVSV